VTLAIGLTGFCSVADDGWLRKVRFAMTQENVCPVCGYALGFQPWQGASSSDEICPSCGIQFGYDDAAGGDAESRGRLYSDWRGEWVAAGMPWRSKVPAPRRWNPEQQLKSFFRSEYAVLWIELERRLKKLIVDLTPQLPAGAEGFAAELIDHNEFGVAFDTLADALVEAKVPISPATFDELSELARLMEYEAWPEGELRGLVRHRDR